MPTSAPMDREPSGVVAFVGFNSRCPREYAGRIAQYVAAAYGIRLHILESETQEDWDVLTPYICGKEKPTTAPSPDEAGVAATVTHAIVVVARDETMVVQAQLVGTEHGYEKFAEGLEALEKIPKDLTERLN